MLSAGQLPENDTEAAQQEPPPPTCASYVRLREPRGIDREASRWGRQTRLRSDEHLRGLEERPAQRLDPQFEAIQAAGHALQEAPLPDGGLLDAGLRAQQR